jgi:predicted ATPase
MEAHRALGAALVLAGRCKEALEHIEMGSALCAAYQNHCYSVFTALDSRVMFDCFAALALLAVGNPDQCTDKLAAGLALARSIGHPPTLVVADHVAAQIHQLRGEAALVHEFAKEAVELSEEYGLELWRAYGIIEMGWAEAELGNVQAGIEQMQRGLALHELMGSKLRLPYFLGLLADQLGKAGRVEEGLATIANALNEAEHSGEGYLLPELHRIKGDLLVRAIKELLTGSVGLKTNPSSTEGSSTLLAQAQSSFAEALAVAKQQQATFLEPRILAGIDRLNEQTANLGS